MTTDGSFLEPMLFQPVLLEKVWGGRRLARLNKVHSKPDALVGESWELADLGSTSASGAGGQAVRSVIVGGPLDGKTIHEAIELHGESIMGGVNAAVGAAGVAGFPLLFKFLDAAQPLSVQVHPSPGYAAKSKTAFLKTESWYVLDAEPDAKLYIGVKQGVTRAAFALAARMNSPKLAEMLNEIPAVPGQCYTLPSGTVHALGAGVLIAEVQTASDTTFRIYDWGRVGREMHVADALRCCRFDDDPAEARVGPDGDPTMGALAESDLCGRLAATDRYTIDEARPLDGDEVTIGYACKSASTPAGAAAPFVLMVLAGSGKLAHAEGLFSTRPISIGQTVLVPAASARQTVLHADRGLRVLRIGLRG